MRASLTVLLLLSIFGAANSFAAQESTEAERLYLDARRSEDRGTQLLGERWYGLVKLQEWNDESGKFTVTAKYVEHDPGMKWVKLRVIKGSGDDRVVKDLTIPMDKLDPRCQSRVRQIAKIEGMVTDAVAAAQVKAKDKDKQPGDASVDSLLEGVPAVEPNPAGADDDGSLPVDPGMATAAMPSEVPDIEAMAMQAVAMQVGIELVSPVHPLGIPAMPVGGMPAAAAP